MTIEDFLGWAFGGAFVLGLAALAGVAEVQLAPATTDPAHAIALAEPPPEGGTQSVATPEPSTVLEEYLDSTLMRAEVEAISTASALDALAASDAPIEEVVRASMASIRAIHAAGQRLTSTANAAGSCILPVAEGRAERAAVMAAMSAAPDDAESLAWAERRQVRLIGVAIRRLEREGEQLRSFANRVGDFAGLLERLPLSAKDVRRLAAELAIQFRRLAKRLDSSV